MRTDKKLDEIIKELMDKLDDDEDQQRRKPCI